MQVPDATKEGADDVNKRTARTRDGDHRRWAGRPLGRLSPGEARSISRDTGRERADRGLLAQALGLAKWSHSQFR